MGSDPEAYANEPKLNKTKQIGNSFEGNKSRKITGRDDIHTALLNKLSKRINEASHKNIQSMIFFGQVTNDGKIANTMAIYKKGFKQDPKNYRLISLTSQVCRVFEKVIKE